METATAAASTVRPHVVQKTMPGWKPNTAAATWVTEKVRKQREAVSVNTPPVTEDAV
jgi:hypothetical protein